MAIATHRARETPEALRRELAAEREQLVDAVDRLRSSTDLVPMLRARLPLFLAGGFAVGFVLAGGIGATARLVFRRGRERRIAARIGPFEVAR